MDNDDGITGMTLSFESTGLSDADRVLLFGDELRTDGEYWESDNSSPKGGFGYVRVMRDNGVRKYEAWIILSIASLPSLLSGSSPLGRSRLRASLLGTTRAMV